MRVLNGERPQLDIQRPGHALAFALAARKGQVGDEHIVRTGLFTDTPRIYESPVMATVTAQFEQRPVKGNIPDIERPD